MSSYPITATVAEFGRLSGLGRSKLYEMMAAGEIESVQLGGRRLIVIDSWRRRVAEALHASQDGPMSAQRRGAAQ